MISDYPSILTIAKEFVDGRSIVELCRKFNLSTDVVEDAIRDSLKDWRFKARHGSKRSTK